MLTFTKYITFLLANVNCSLYAIIRPSSVTFVHPTQLVEIIGNVSVPFGTLAIHNPLTFTENFTEIVPGEPLSGGFKHKRGSQI